MTSPGVNGSFIENAFAFIPSEDCQRQIIDIYTRTETLSEASFTSDGTTHTISFWKLRTAIASYLESNFRIGFKNSRNPYHERWIRQWHFPLLQLAKSVLSQTQSPDLYILLYLERKDAGTVYDLFLSMYAAEQQLITEKMLLVAEGNVTYVHSMLQDIHRCHNLFQNNSTFGSISMFISDYENFQDSALAEGRFTQAQIRFERIVECATGFLERSGLSTRIKNLDYEEYFRFFENYSLEAYHNYFDQCWASLLRLKQILLSIQEFYKMDSRLYNDLLKIKVDATLSQVDRSIQLLVSKSAIFEVQPPTSVKKQTKPYVSLYVVQPSGIHTTDIGAKGPCFVLTILKAEEYDELRQYQSGVAEDFPNFLLPLMRAQEKEIPTELIKDRNAWHMKFEKRELLDDRPIKGKNVLHQMYYALFTARINLNGTLFLVTACSNPFICTTNVSQDLNATATLMWHRMLQVYSLPANSEKVPMENFLDMLELYVRHETKSPKVVLPVCAKETWRMKLYEALLQEDPENSLTKIVKAIKPNRRSARPKDLEVMLRCDFEKMIKPKQVPQSEAHSYFWNWINDAIQLIQQDAAIRNLFQKGAILFIPRDLAHNVVAENGFGSFLLRFMDSMSGTLSIALNDGNEIVSGVCTIPNEEVLTKSILDNPRLVKIYRYLQTSGQFNFADKKDVFRIPNLPASPTQDLQTEPTVKPKFKYVKGFLFWSNGTNIKEIQS